MADLNGIEININQNGVIFFDVDDVITTDIDYKNPDKSHAKALNIFRECISDLPNIRMAICSSSAKLAGEEDMRAFIKNAFSNRVEPVFISDLNKNSLLELRKPEIKENIAVLKYHDVNNIFNKITAFSKTIHTIGNKGKLIKNAINQANNTQSSLPIIDFNKCVLIDDHEANIESTKFANIKGIHVNTGLNSKEKIYRTFVEAYNSSSKLFEKKEKISTRFSNFKKNIFTYTPQRISIEDALIDALDFIKKERPESECNLIEKYKHKLKEEKQKNNNPKTKKSYSFVSGQKIVSDLVNSYFKI